MLFQQTLNCIKQKWIEHKKEISKLANVIGYNYSQ